MSNENEEGLKKVAANPYNMRKAWHTENSMPKPLQNAEHEESLAYRKLYAEATPKC